MIFDAISAGLGVLGAGAKIFSGISQNKKANEIEKNNPRPDYVIPDQFKQNYALAKQMAQVGLPQQQYQNQMNNINQNQAGALQNLSRSANQGANLAAIVRGGDAATNNLNAQDAAARQGNQRYAIQQNSVLGGQELAKQQSDKFDKYTENYNRAAALRGAGNQNIYGGAGDLAGLGAAGLSGDNPLFGGQKTPQQTMGQVNGNPTLSAATGAGINTPAFQPPYTQQYYNPLGNMFKLWQ